MKIITNTKLIRRNSRIGQIASIAGLLTLAGGMVISFRYPEQFGIAWGALLLGFALSQVGLFFGNRWGRRPRPDEHLDNALKGLDDKYSFYHYATPASHLLIGPAGILVLLPYNQKGKIVYEKNRWRQKGGSFFQKYLRVFAQEGIGRPDLDASNDIHAIQKLLSNKLPDDELPTPQALIVFTNDLAEIEVEDAPLPSLPARKLKEYIRKTSKTKPLSLEKVGKIQSLFES